ncbi:phosphatase PAP2 family protein [Kiloniella laminariae]|uniref:Phosphatase PAP2 family protein n=1 Tax=Kiloniella laminariae TaxID=454162 RepID=A0ABT4LGE2_9PROT|nr:phosphatase PAP2 family protein [Kiloniella laminariae]MCZ4280164.1 phosphatase PAP2 family protein [Kiloniella laminariae]
MQRDLIGTRWQPRNLVLSFGLATLIGLSYIWGPTSELWRAISTDFFYIVNGSLSWGETWQIIWAATNTPLSDKLNGLVMAIPCLWYVTCDRSRPLNLRLAHMLVMGVAIVVGVYFAKHAFREYESLSPSLVLTPFNDLTQLVPWLPSKVSADDSFPGNHAVVAGIYGFFFAIAIGRKYFWLALPIALMGGTARAVAGAHWLSDLLVGGAIHILPLLALAFATPAIRWAQNFLDTLADVLLLNLPTGLTRPFVKLVQKIS